jgi:HAMP domain-containing protein
VINIVNAFLCLILILQTIRKEIYEFYNALKFNNLGIWNIVDITSLFLNLAYIILILVYVIDGSTTITYDARAFVITLGAYATFLMWVRVFQWMKLLDLTSYYVSQIYETAISTLGFLTLLILCIFSFSNFFFQIQQNLKDDGEKSVNGNTESYVNYVETTIGIPFLDAIISMYLLALGEFAIDGYNEGYNKTHAWGMFLLATIVIMLLFMNFVIAIMSEPFERVKDNAVQYRYSHKLDLIVDNIELFDKKKFGTLNKKYILVVKPEEEEIEGGATLEDDVNELQQDFQK